MNLRQLGIGARGLPVRSDGQIILLLDDVFLPESLMHACGIGIDAGELAIGPAGELRPGDAQLVRIFRFLWSQLHKLLVFLDGSYPVVRDLVGSRQLQVGLWLFRQQGDGALEFAHGLGILSERQEAGTEEQAGRAVIRLKSEGLTKSRDRFGVLAAQLRDDAEVVIDERMLDFLPQGVGEDLLSGIQIAGFERLDACGDFCFERRRQVFLCESTGSDAEVQQEKRTKAWGSSGKNSKAQGLRPEA